MVRVEKTFLCECHPNSYLCPFSSFCHFAGRLEINKKFNYDYGNQQEENKTYQ